jgi:hypothetical protein
MWRFYRKKKVRRGGEERSSIEEKKKGGEGRSKKGGDEGRRRINESPSSQKIRQIGYRASRLLKKLGTCPNQTFQNCVSGYRF